MKKIALLCVCAFTSVPAVCNAQVDTRWEIHDRNRPLPPVLDPGTASTQDLAGRPPSDAVVLFDGKDLSQWVEKKDGSPAKWKVENGHFEVVPKNGGHSNARSLRRVPVARGICRAVARERRRSGPRQQRRFPARTLRNASPGFVSKQDLCRRPSRGDLWTISSARERFASAGPVADLRHHFSWPAF